MPIRKNRQRGFTLLELTVVLIIAAAIVYALSNALTSYDRWRRAVAWGEQMNEVVTALEGYGTRYRAQLVNGLAVTGYVDPLAPTIAELRDDDNGALLPPGFSETPLPGGAYVISVTVIPAGCAPNDCDLQYWVYGTRAATRLTSNAVDFELAARAAAAIRANRGGWSEGDFFRGIADAWSIRNPTETAPDAGDGNRGLLGALASYRSGLLAQYLRIDGSNQMAANLNVGGNDIINARNTNTQQVTFTTAATAGAACATANQITAGADGVPLVCLSSSWRRIGWRYAAAGAACTGTEIAADTSGQALVCRSSTFVALADRLPRVVTVSQGLANHGVAIAKPTCGTGGTAELSLVPINPGSDFTIAPPATRMNVTWTDNGTSWTPVVQAVDQSRTASTLSVQALATTYCVYP